MTDHYIVAADKLWRPNLIANLAEKTAGKFFLIRDKKELTSSFLQEINPKYLFFPHWSSIVPSTIYENYECVIFHMTDLPFGRGGSPLQNLIARGIYETKLSAIKCATEIDSGPIYLQYPLSLAIGTAQEIYQNANAMIEKMIIEIVLQQPKPCPQVGEPVYFKRRKPEEGNIANLTELDKLYDYIRMLDADGYPHAYYESEHLRMEFRRAQLRGNEIIADVKITRKDDGENSSEKCEKNLKIATS